MITAIGDVMRECYKRNWITTRDGNCSVRRKEYDVLYITPSGMRKNIIYPESVLRLKIDKQAGEPSLILKEGQSPSGELEMHWLIQKYHDKTRCVLHVHPTYIIAAMYAGYDLQALSEEFPEVHRYTKVGPNVPVLPAISYELAERTADKLEVNATGGFNYDIVGQAQHGCCAIGKSPWHAFEHVERLEHICKITLAAKK